RDKTLFHWLFIYVHQFYLYDLLSIHRLCRISDRDHYLPRVYFIDCDALSLAILVRNNRCMAGTSSCSRYGSINYLDICPQRCSTEAAAITQPLSLGNPQVMSQYIEFCIDI